MYHYLEIKKPRSGVQDAPKRETGALPAALPNSAVLSMLGGASGYVPDSSLEERISSRLPGIQPQIPAAEREADQLSNSVRTGSPEAVKRAMGDRMGADFSNVRFHTGAAAAAKAAAMNAQAFTTGPDVYFGPGGFEPSVAAHELVHTVQQGAVDSGVSTLSAPMGGVQRKENPFKWLWRKTGGKLIRDNHDAMVERLEAKDSGDWEAMSTGQRVMWNIRNPIAAMRMALGGGDKARALKAKRESEQTAAHNFLTTWRDSAEGQAVTQGTSMLGDPRNEPVELDSAGQGMMDVEEASDAAGNFVGDPLALGGDIRAVMDGNTASSVQRRLKGAGGVIATGGAIVGAVSSGRDIYQAYEDKDLEAGISAGADMTASLSDLTGGINTIAEAAGAGSDAVGSVTGSITGGISALRGAYNAMQGDQKADAMNGLGAEIQEAYKDTDRSSRSEDVRVLQDIAAQGALQGERERGEGIGEGISGVMDVIGSFADPATGAVLHGASSAVKLGTKAYGAYKEAQMKERVTEQAAGITNEMIERFQEQAHIDSFSRAKQSLMRELGYSSGQRAELVAHQTQKRSERLAEMAGRSGGDSRITGWARKMLAGLGIKADDQGQYDVGKTFQSLGGNRSRDEIVSRRFRIRAAAASNRRRNNPQPTP